MTDVLSSPSDGTPGHMGVSVASPRCLSLNFRRHNVFILTHRRCRLVTGKQHDQRTNFVL